MAKGTRFEYTDEPGLRRSLGKMTERAQYALDNQVLRDTDAYVPFAQGALSKSAFIASDIGKGIIAWQTPYAKVQYYSRPNKSTGIHAKATVKWFEAAKSANKTRWIEVSKKAARRL